MGNMKVSSKSMYSAVSEQETGAKGVRLGANVVTFIHSDKFY